MSKLATKHKNIFEIANKSIMAKENGLSIIIPNCVSNTGIYPKGFAETVSLQYPNIKVNYQLLGKSFLQRNPGYVQFVDVDREPEYNRRLIVATMVAQNGITQKSGRRSLNYAYLTKSFLSIKSYILKDFNEENKVCVYLSKPMFKNGGGNWSFIEYLIQDVWHDINVEVF